MLALISAASKVDTDILVLVIVGLLLGVLEIFAIATVLSKAGYSGWWALIAFIPVLNIIMFFVFAFSPWPVLDRANSPILLARHVETPQRSSTESVSGATPVPISPTPDTGQSAPILADPHPNSPTPATQGNRYGDNTQWTDPS